MQNSGLTFGDLVWVVLAFLTLAGTGWAIWWKIVGLVNEAKAAAYHKSDEAKLKADAAAATAMLAREELAEYKTHVAESYISKQGFRETMDSVAETLKTINANLTHLNERIDRVIDNQHGAPKRGGGQQ